MPVIYAYIDKKYRFKYAVLYIGHSHVLVPEEELTAVGIAMLLIKAHHVFQVAYTPANEVLALILEMTLCGFKKNETDCMPNPAFEQFISSLGYFSKCY
jgi:hypothetical protein